MRFAAVAALLLMLAAPDYAASKTLFGPFSNASGSTIIDIRCNPKWTLAACGARVPEWTVEDQKWGIPDDAYIVDQCRIYEGNDAKVQTNHGLMSLVEACLRDADMGSKVDSPHVCTFAASTAECYFRLHYR